MGEEGKVLIGIAGIVFLLILIFNPSILIGILVYATTAIVLVGGFAFCVFMMFLILKEIFR